MNIVNQINEQYTYAEIARRIKSTTGRNYHPQHIGNVARGFRAVSDGLMFNLTRAFPEFFAPTAFPSGEIDNREVKR